MKMHKVTLLPRLAVSNIRKNGSTYFPYIGVSIFAMFTYLVFDLIQKSDVMSTLPRAVYAGMLIYIGFWLLGIIMVPFLYYTNSFLIKRRKKELGLYSILGMEKKHIGILMFWESLIVYGMVMAGAVALGLLFYRLVFLLLINLAKLPLEVDFSIHPGAVLDTLIFYAVVTALNLFVNLIQVGKARPVELMSESKKGEKKPNAFVIGLMTVLGCILMGTGYLIAVTAKLDSMIFADFFLAVFLVILGTYFLFTSGSIALLYFLKRRKQYYYRAENFVTVSGMLYRMKKNAAGLSNICIFGTMVMITVICTLSVWLGMDSILSIMCPNTFKLSFFGRQEETVIQTKLEQLAKDIGVELEDYTAHSYVGVEVYHEDGVMRKPVGSEQYRYENLCDVELMELEDYNRMEETDKKLSPGEVLIFSAGSDWDNEHILLGEQEYRVQEELRQCRLHKKAPGDDYNGWYLVVLQDAKDVEEAATVFDVNSKESMLTEIAANPKGDNTDVDAFFEAVNTSFEGKEDLAGCVDKRQDVADVEAMFGGLLFVGIFFGAIFLICLMIIMYYRQITEGFEDQKNFDIMQKVGMSDEEIRRTIRKQILLVFALPLAGAMCHTIVGMKMVIVLMSALRFVEVPLMLGCTMAVCTVFAVLYGICYRRTSATYYRIVKRMN